MHRRIKVAESLPRAVHPEQAPPPLRVELRHARAVAALNFTG